VARGGRTAAAPEGMGLSEIGHLADLVARFAEKTLPTKAKT
jgi:DNA repair protein RadA/Sms